MIVPCPRGKQIRIVALILQMSGADTQDSLEVSMSYGGSGVANRVGGVTTGSIGDETVELIAAIGLNYNGPKTTTQSLVTGAFSFQPRTRITAPLQDGWHEQDVVLTSAQLSSVAVTAGTILFEEQEQPKSRN